MMIIETGSDIEYKNDMKRDNEPKDIDYYQLKDIMERIEENFKELKRLLE